MEKAKGNDLNVQEIEVGETIIQELEKGGWGKEISVFASVPEQNENQTFRRACEEINKRSTTQQIAGVFFLAGVLFWLPFQRRVT